MSSASSTEDLDLLRTVSVNAGTEPGALVEIVVAGCAYSCCGRGWRRRDGYEQTYVGYIDNFREPDPAPRGRSRWENSEAPAGVGSFMLYAAGIGTISYVVAATFPELLDVRRADF